MCLLRRVSLCVSVCPSDWLTMCMYVCGDGYVWKPEDNLRYWSESICFVVWNAVSHWSGFHQVDEAGSPVSSREWSSASVFQVLPLQVHTTVLPSRTLLKCVFCWASPNSCAFKTSTLQTEVFLALKLEEFSMWQQYPGLDFCVTHYNVASSTCFN